MTALGDDDKASIQQSIDDEVLEGTPIAFRSTAVNAGASRPGAWTSRATSSCTARHHPIAFDLVVGEDGTLTGSAVVRQSDWGMKPYSTLFGTFKVVDEVEVLVSAVLQVGH